MKHAIALVVVGLIGISALVWAGYCVWLTTMSLSYRRLGSVETELLVSLGVFGIALISSVVIIILMLRSRRPPSGAESKPTVL